MGTGSGPWKRRDFNAGVAESELKAKAELRGIRGAPRRGKRGVERHEEQAWSSFGGSGRGPRSVGLVARAE
jgi:hypothetical protein